MHMLDLVIKNGEVIDGVGNPRIRADVGILGGRVVEIGQIGDPARRTIDADGRVVAPGFIDVHTHYDAQAFWDPTLSPSPLHGVTTVLAGNCGFSIAPLDDHAGEYLMRMLSRVEGIPLESLQQGGPWDWRSTAEYLGKLDGRLAVNAGFSVGHSALRRVVMGEASTERAATPEELAAMCALLRRGLASGGIGFSSSRSRTHNDPDGVAVPSRLATDDELVALSQVCREFPGTSLEFIPGPGPFSDAEVELMTRMSVAAQRPLNWNVMFVTEANHAACFVELGAGTHARERGGKVVALTCPYTPQLVLSFLGGVGYDTLPGWDAVMAMSREEKLKAFSEPDSRRRLKEQSKGALANAGLARFFSWETKVIAQTFDEETARYQGRTVGEIARSEGKDPFDALADIVCADRMLTTFLDPAEDSAADWAARVDIWRDDRTLIGGSDAGAHLDLLATYDITTAFLAGAVREHGLLPLEEAVQMITDEPAQLFGLNGRGRLEVGSAADVVVFDPAEIGPEAATTRFDLPAEAGRLYSGATGIAHVIVNGTEIVTSGELTDDRPGHVLRSGADTRTPTL
jgi:N-acyl-D-aspartate/D-glutamate deacylase